MRIEIGNGRFIHVQTVPNTCNHCTKQAFHNKAPDGFSVCGHTGKSIFHERHEGSCTMDGLNFKDKHEDQ